jgi:hypothetical protein
VLGEAACGADGLIMMRWVGIAARGVGRKQLIRAHQPTSV